jgi:hypothetical protein
MTRTPRVGSVRAMSRLSIVYEDDRAILAKARNVGLVGWREAPTPELIGHWHRLGRALAKEHAKSACIDIVLRGTPRFSDAMRREAERLASDASIFPLGFAHIVLAPGLAGTAVRAFISTVLLVTRPPAPARVFADARGAATWLVPRLAETGWTEPAIVDASNELIDRLG